MLSRSACIVGVALVANALLLLRNPRAL